MLLTLLASLLLPALPESKMVISVLSKPNQVVTRENLKAARICDGRERKCQDGSRAGLVLPDCELVCPEDNRQDLSCYQGLIDEDEYEYRWVEAEVPGTPVIYSAGGSWSGPETRGLNCTVFEEVSRPAIPAASFRQPAMHRPKKVRPAR